MSLQEPYLPTDFDEFWGETLQGALDAPLVFERHTQSTVDRSGFTIDVIDFRGVDGRKLYGWFAYPELDDTAPGFLWLPPYGRWSMMPNEYGTREGFCSMSLNNFGEHAFHSETYKPERGYLTEGIESPQTWVFRRIFQDSVIAGRIMETFSEVDPERIGSMGMSQGGGLSIWLGAFFDRIKCVVADMPFGAARPIVFARDIHRYPLREAIDWWGTDSKKREAAMRTMSYFDTVNIATRCKVPTLVTFGFKDPAVKEFEVRSIFEALPGLKEIDAVDGGHDWHPSMVERNREWLSAHL